MCVTPTAITKLIRFNKDLKSFFFFFNPQNVIKDWRNQTEDDRDIGIYLESKIQCGEMNQIAANIEIEFGGGKKKARSK